MHQFDEAAGPPFPTDLRFDSPTVDRPGAGDQSAAAPGEPTNQTGPSDPINPVEVSWVMPVRDCASEVLGRIERIQDLLGRCGIPSAELVIVDDGSLDTTRDAVDEALMRLHRVRLLRHDRPRGLESAGQTGLERATGQVVIIQENQHPPRESDVRQLLGFVADAGVVAARVHTNNPHADASNSLIRRMRSTVSDLPNRWADAQDCSPIQLVRRNQLPSAQPTTLAQKGRWRHESWQSRSSSV